MDSLDAIKKLCELYPDASPEDMRAAYEAELDWEYRKRGRGTTAYQIAVDTAFDRIKHWIEDGEAGNREDCGFDRDLCPLNRDRALSFIMRARQSCVWAVLFGMQRKAVAR